MKVRNIVWALMFLIPGAMFANMDVDQKSDTNIALNDNLNQAVNIDETANSIDSLDLEDGASDDWWGGGGWGRWGGGGWGRWGGGCGGGCGGGWGWPYWGVVLVPSFGYWGGWGW